MQAADVLLLDVHTTLADVARFAAAQPWTTADPAHVDDLRLLLEELLSNVVRHAFAGYRSPAGACQLLREPGGETRIELHDNGPPFDPFDPVNPPGYGLTLARALAGPHVYRFEDGCNRLEIRMRGG